MAAKRERYSKHDVDSTSTFIETIFEIRDRWNDESPDEIDPWYRGHSNEKHLLLPGILRKNLPEDDETEDDMRLDFKQKAVPLLDFAPPTSEWEWYFLMQHYGLPTRLLDWSESALVALLFAVSGPVTEKAAVWMLDPWRLNQLSLGTEEIHLCTDPEVAQYLAEPHSETWEPPTGPAAIYPAHHFRRIASQCGFFTIHGVRKSLEKYVPLERVPMLARITIPSQEIQTIRKDLRHLGMSYATIFPDLDGLARAIRMEWIDDNV